MSYCFAGREGLSLAKFKDWFDILKDIYLALTQKLEDTFFNIFLAKEIEIFLGVVFLSTAIMLAHIYLGVFTVCRNVLQTLFYICYLI